MAVRLFPDIIAANEIKNFMNIALVICKNNGRLGADNFFKEIPEIPVSVKKCVQAQESCARRGIGNAVLGFGGGNWTAEEFENFFKRNPSLYRHVSGDIYAAVLGNAFKGPDVSGEEKIRSRIKEFCFGLLADDTYDTEVLKKFGLERPRRGK